MTDDGLAAEIAAGERTDGRAHRLLARARARLDGSPWLRLTYKVLVTLVGGAVVAVGIALLVLPGPGWLVIFLGLGILGTEFPAVRRLTDRFKALVLRVWHRWRTRRARRAADDAA
ncbi:MAG: PGPGW domain-containing protein [Micrococcales bacterium]|nr:PGPGW domain-containing protein [Micrococcales bacterium]